MKHIATAVAASLLTIFALAPQGPVARTANASDGQIGTSSEVSQSGEGRVAIVPAIGVAQSAAGWTLAQNDAGQAQENSDNASDADNSGDTDDQNNADTSQNGDPDNGADADQNAQAGDNGDNGGQEPGYAGDAQSDNGDAANPQLDSGGDSADQNADNPTAQ